MADINAAIKAAQESAGEIVDAEAQYDVPAQTQQSAEVVPFQKPSMETMGNSTGIASSVDTWLKVKEDGMKIGTEKGLIVDKVKVKIKMVEEDGFFVKQSIKWGNPVTYASTYDGRMSDKGGAWGDQLAMVRAIDPKAKPFPSADIIMVLDQDVKMKETTVKKGTKVGHTLSMSNWGNWSEFYREVAAAGKVGEEIDVLISAEEVNGNNGYTWGVVAFELAK
tara:strand:+ start:1464 stop:2129 length:666 start_codon:yes stop_codon:yes gene_type:complete